MRVASPVRGVAMLVRADPLQPAPIQHLGPRKQRAGIELAMDFLRRIVAGWHHRGIQILMPGDLLQIREIVAQLGQQGAQGADLGGGVRLGHLLVP